VAETKALLLASAALMGIFLISVLAEQIELGLTDLEDISAFMLNEPVHVRGVVQEYQTMSMGIKLLLNQGGYTTYVVYFGEAKGKKGMCADAVGEVKTSEGTIEIIADRLSLFIC